jgi:hypothetical protein
MRLQLSNLSGLEAWLKFKISNQNYYLNHQNARLEPWKQNFKLILSTLG